MSSAVIEMEQSRLTFSSPITQAVSIVQQEALTDEEMMFMVELLEDQAKAQVLVGLKGSLWIKWIRRMLSAWGVGEGAGGGSTQQSTQLGVGRRMQMSVGGRTQSYAQQEEETQDET
jgi:hypothetical protein